MRDSAYDAVEFVQRHVLRRGGGGDPRERAVQAVVRMAVGVRDTIRLRLLIERASQVFGLSEEIIARAVRLAGAGQGSESPVSSAVGAQRRVGDDLEHRALRALLHAPEVLEWARGHIGPGDFRGPAAGSLAVALWEGGDVTAMEGQAGDLARELQAGAPGDFDWHSEASGAVRMLKVRGLEQSRREIRARLAGARGDEATRLMAEIDLISKQILELKS